MTLGEFAEQLSAKLDHLAFVQVSPQRHGRKVTAWRRTEKCRAGIDIRSMELTLLRTMRGEDKKQASMLMLMSPETRVPQTHPLRAIKKLADEALAKLSPVFDAMYAEGGRPSIPPERLLKSMLLIALYSMRSERQFCEQLDYNLLFRWFLDMDMVEPSFVPTVFTHNRERLIIHDAAGEFLRAIVEQARKARLMSADHFTVDGTLIESWASLKSFKKKDDDQGPPDDPACGRSEESAGQVESEVG
jgi:transposase